jgi:hypothetical protein
MDTNLKTFPVSNACKEHGLTCGSVDRALERTIFLISLTHEQSAIQAPFVPSCLRGNFIILSPSIQTNHWSFRLITCGHNHLFPKPFTHKHRKPDHHL